MPRTVGQNNRRKLGFASNLIRRAVKNIVDILPWELETGDWDEKFRMLSIHAATLLDIAEYLDNLITPFPVEIEEGK